MTAAEHRYIEAIAELHAARHTGAIVDDWRGELSYEVAESYEGLRLLGWSPGRIRDLHGVGATYGRYLARVRGNREAASCQ